MAVFSDTIVVWIQFCGTLWVGLTEKNVWGVVGSLCGLGLPFTEADLGPLVILHILRRKLQPAAKINRKKSPKKLPKKGPKNCQKKGSKKCKKIHNQVTPSH